MVHLLQAKVGEKWVYLLYPFSPHLQLDAEDAQVLRDGGTTKQKKPGFLLIGKVTMDCHMSEKERLSQSIEIWEFICFSSYNTICILYVSRSYTAGFLPLARVLSCYQTNPLKSICLAVQSISPPLTEGLSFIQRTWLSFYYI